jgi:hypothetical protein
LPSEYTSADGHRHAVFQTSVTQFWCAIESGTRDLVGHGYARALVVDETNSEISEYGGTIFAQEDVLRLYVSVNDTWIMIVRVSDGVADLAEGFENAQDWRADAWRIVSQRAAWAVFCHQKRPFFRVDKTIGVIIDDAQNVGVLKLLASVNLLQEAVGAVEIFQPLENVFEIVSAV